MASYEKSVKGATKIKLAPPKAKYIEHILQATRSGESGVSEIFKTLQFRLRDSTWTIAFKALIVVHIMIREGDPEATLRYLATDHRRVMAFSTYSDVQTQGRNIRTYSGYLVERARSYAKTKQDYVGGGSARLKKLSVEKGLLRETESVQEIINALVKCDLFASEPENEITLTAFRLLTMDLLVLFQAMNEGTINILEHYFEMSKPDAERALVVYKTFTKQTDKVVRFLQTARAYEYSTRLEIPKIKHAPTSLATSLEEYLNDRDFETNRRQYLAQQEAKRGGGGSSSATRPTFAESKTAAPSKPSAAFPEPASPARLSKGPAPDLIDFFSSIEQNQQPMAQNSSQFQQQMGTNPFAQMQQPQQTGFWQPQQQQPVQQQSTNPFGQPQQQQQQQQPQMGAFAPQMTQGMQMQPTGFAPQPAQQQAPTGFGQQASQQQQHQQAQFDAFGMSNGFGAPQQQSPQQQQSAFGMPQQQSPQQQQSPFGMPQHQPTSPQQLQAQSTNPFRASMLPQQTGGTNPFSQASPPPMPPMPTQQAQQPTGLTPQRTGTNPFAKPTAPPAGQPSALISQATGSTNPFRQSAFVGAGGQGWQTQQGTMGGLENLQTVSVFPRPGQPQQQQQQQQQQQMGGHANGAFGGWV